ncbi:MULTISPECIES: hypothetical protein [unclassified Nocardioides]|uniref:hypothetical protein n=1 Tax=unclassified Nocardioides TaxID=2615069 RepID=UPI0009F140DE|nr:MULTISPECIES: hypothetical protein [unclassified Nocardioides]GAW49250.1 Putative uncharacterized protein [Nocardioides sp. PD653-B2]GAW55738.1 putative uncharacterized protein [Nocardioides sp. PD653]
MARRKLTIVVTCTDRKLGLPSETLMARSLPAGTVTERASHWHSRVTAARSETRLLDLYKGESWSQAKRLACTAEKAGFDAEMLVASAGLGLRSVKDLGPVYAATFTRGHQDSVATSTADSALWWSRLPHTVAPTPEVPSIWVLSESYALAMSDQLSNLDPDDSLVFGGAPDTPESLRVRSDRNLRAALGGTVTSLNTRMAIRWLEIAGRSAPTSTEVRHAWAAWASDAHQPEQYDRRPLPDGTIRLLIKEMLGRHPQLSKTVALRNLRASGIACEQRRFSGLFEEACNE